MGPLSHAAKEIALKNYYDTNPDLDAMLDKLYDAFMLMEPAETKKKAT